MNNYFVILAAGKGIRFDKNKAKQFFEAGEEMIKNECKVKNEYYVSEIYNMLLRSNAKFEIDLVEKFSPLGTPNDLKKFEI